LKQEAIDEIFRYSKGIPRLINILCDNSLTIGYATDKKKIHREIIKEAIDDLETGQRRYPEPVEIPFPAEREKVKPLGKKPKESYLEEPKKRATKRWRVLPLGLWVYVLLSRIYLLIFGSGRNKKRILGRRQPE
jgi:hypothetical protein